MFTYALRRAFYAIPTLLATSAIIFFAMRAIPGDPVTLWLSGETYDPALRDLLMKQYGFDRPPVVAYFDWLSKALTGDLGASVWTGKTVFSDIMTRLPISLELAVLAVVIALVIAVPAGIISATRRNTKLDYVVSVSSLIGQATPDFYLAILMIFAFAVCFRVLPSGGYVDLWADPVGHFSRMLLPAIALGAPRAAVLSRLLRSSMLDVLGEDYIRTARAKGLRKSIVIGKHAVRNALIPLVTMTGLQIGFVVGGAVIVESIFQIPGVGSWGLNAIYMRDYPRVQGFILVVTAVFILSNLLIDLTYGLINPKVRYE